MYSSFIVHLLITISTAISSTAHPAAKTPDQFLTSKEWIIETQGYDHNDNGRIDPLEEDHLNYRIGDVYLFHSNGSGIYYNEGFSCDGADEQPFTWKLRQNASLLDLGVFSVPILRLDENKLVLYMDEKQHNGTMKRYMSIFKH